MFQLKSILILVAIVYIVHAEQYTNPVVAENAPDPGVLYDKASDSYYSVTTTGIFRPGHNSNFPIHVSKNLGNWTFAGFAFQDGKNPTWAKTKFWAPELHIITPGLYHMYFTAEDTTGVLCVGVATSKNVLGPYIDALGKPLVRDPKMGSIDATIMHTNEGKYLVWKSDGNAIGVKTPIWRLKLSADGLSTSNDPIQLLTNDQPWEGPLVEGPWHLYREPYHYIFYSANGFYGEKYAVGIARSKKSEGPYEKNPKPILVTNSGWNGPGHCSVVTTRGGKYVMVYHAWPKETFKKGRWMLVDEVKWSDQGWPYLDQDAPSKKPKPTPE